MLCAINNIQSGGCREDCKFCTQSVHNNAKIQTYTLKSSKQILQEAMRAKENAAVGFCLVTSGKALSDNLCEAIAKTAHTIKQHLPEFNLIACNGIATKQQLQHLKNSGVDSYNHNLESAKGFYEQICTTHSWDDRYQTCINVKETGLNLCCGGIFGMGENSDDRLELLQTIAAIDPKTTPINFFMPSEGLGLHVTPIAQKEALEVVKLARKILPNQKLMAAGGREMVFKRGQKQLFEAGIDAIVIGDYLTTRGAKTAQDIQMLKDYGYEIATKCK